MQVEHQLHVIGNEVDSGRIHLGQRLGHGKGALDFPFNVQPFLSQRRPVQMVQAVYLARRGVGKSDVWKACIPA